MTRKFFNIFRKKKKHAISFKSGMDLTNLPIITVRHKDKKLNLLLDTGSTCCILDEKIIKKLDYEETDETGETQTIIDGAVKGKFYNINIQFDSELFYTCPFFSMNFVPIASKIKKSSGVTVHGIIGSDFFETFKYIIDFKKLIAYSKA